MLTVLKVSHGFRFPMFRCCILSDVVVVHNVIHFKTLQFLNGEKVIYDGAMV